MLDRSLYQSRSWKKKRINCLYICKKERGKKREGNKEERE